MSEERKSDDELLEASEKIAIYMEIGRDGTRVCTFLGHAGMLLPPSFASVNDQPGGGRVIDERCDTALDASECVLAKARKVIQSDRDADRADKEAQEGALDFLAQRSRTG